MARVAVLDRISSSSAGRILNVIHAVCLLLVSAVILFLTVSLIMMFEITLESPSVFGVLSYGLIAVWGATGGFLVILRPGKKSTRFAFLWYAIIMINFVAHFLIAPLFRGSGID